MWTLYISFCVVGRFIENAASCQLFRIGDMHICYNPYTHNQLSAAVKGLQRRLTVYVLFVSDQWTSGQNVGAR